MKQENFKLHILVPLALALGLLLGTFVAAAYWTQQRGIVDNVTRDLSLVRDAYTVHLKEDLRPLNTVADLILTDEGLRAALRAKDREALLERATPLMKRIHCASLATHLYFSDPDRVNILRVHQPDRYGDTINRFTTLEARSAGLSRFPLTSPFAVSLHLVRIQDIQGSIPT